MDLKKILFNEQASKTSKCFETKLSEIKLKHKDFIESNEIDFDNSIIQCFDNFYIKYCIQNKISPEIEKEIESAFQECLTKFQS